MTSPSYTQLLLDTGMLNKLNYLFKNVGTFSVCGAPVRRFSCVAIYFILITFLTL